MVRIARKGDMAACLTGSMPDLGSLIVQMEAIGARLVAADDERQHFHNTYLRTTRAVKDEINRGGFLDPEWTERWDLVFAQLYLDAFAAGEGGHVPPGPWQVAFTAAIDPAVPPLRHVLLGINAHVNYDLPQALLAVITADEFDDENILAKRAADHAHVDSILVRRVPEEDKELAQIEEPGDRTFADRLMQPFNRAGTKRFLKEAREKVWQNTRRLNQARRRGPEVYAAALARLEELCRRRVADLVEPRFVIVRLAVRGFGVTLD